MAVSECPKKTDEGSCDAGGDSLGCDWIDGTCAVSIVKTLKESLKSPSVVEYFTLLEQCGNGEEGKAQCAAAGPYDGVVGFSAGAAVAALATTRGALPGRPVERRRAVAVGPVGLGVRLEQTLPPLLEPLARRRLFGGVIRYLVAGFPFVRAHMLNADRSWRPFCDEV